MAGIARGEGISRNLLGAGTALACVLVALWPAAVQAAELPVTSSEDAGEGSLRAAVAAAANGDEIVIAAGINPTLTSGHLTVDGKAIVVRGQGSSSTTVSAGGLSRIFDVTTTGSLRIEDVTLTEGKAPSGICCEANRNGEPGGAIRNLGVLVVLDSALSNNRGGEAGPFTSNGAANGGGGGAIYNSGTATITRSRLVGNNAGVSNSAGSGTPSERNGGRGGAVFNAASGTLTISDSELVDNRSGGAAYASPPYGPGTGGAILNAGTMTVSGSEITGSRIGTVPVVGAIGGDGGGIHNTASAEAAINSTLLEDNHAGNRGCQHAVGRGGAIRNDGSLTIAEGSSVLLNRAGNNPSEGCQTAHATGGSAGAILNTGGAVLEILDSTVAQNRATDGRTDNDPRPDGGVGGAILNQIGADLVVARSTFAGNQGGNGGFGVARPDGGHGGNGGAIFNQGSLTAIASTFSGNAAGDGGETFGSDGGEGGDGGAIANTSTGTLALTSLTVTANRVGVGRSGGANGQGSGITSLNPAAGADTVKASIIAGNTGASQCVGGELGSLGYNLVGVNSQCPTNGPNDIAQGPAGIGPLADNGGPVETHALTASSPALDRHSAADPDCTGTDTRGIPRPEGPGCDSGAYELAADRTLTVDVVGRGTVTGPAGLACPPTCSVALPAATNLELTASPLGGSAFAGYSGDCTGDSCALTMTGDRSVTATFSGDGAGSPKASLSLRGKRNRGIALKLRVGDTDGLRSVILATPRKLKLAKGKRLRRLARARVDEGKLPRSAITRKARSIKVKPQDSETLVLKLKPNGLRAKNPLKRKAKLTFRLRIVDSDGATERLTLKKRVRR